MDDPTPYNDLGLVNTRRGGGPPASGSRSPPRSGASATQRPPSARSPARHLNGQMRPERPDKTRNTSSDGPSDVRSTLPWRAKTTDKIH